MEKRHKREKIICNIIAIFILILFLFSDLLDGNYIFEIR